MAKNVELTLRDTIAIVIRAFIAWVLIYGILFFRFLGAEYITETKFVFYFIIGITSLFLLIILDWAFTLNKKAKGKVYGYLQDGELTPDFILKSKYWGRRWYRLTIVTLIIFTAIWMIGAYGKSATFGSIAEATPSIAKVSTDSPTLLAMTHVVPATLVELAVTALIISLLFTALASVFTFLGKTSLVIVMAILAPITMGAVSYFWHLRAYEASAPALYYVTFLFALGAFLIVITGSLIIFDIIHIMNNLVLGLFLTSAGVVLLKIALPIALLIFITIWNIDYRIYRGGKRKKRFSKNKFLRGLQRTVDIIFPV